jgi:hypothetical protein
MPLLRIEIWGTRGKIEGNTNIMGVENLVFDCSHFDCAGEPQPIGAAAYAAGVFFAGRDAGTVVACV